MDCFKVIMVVDIVFSLLAGLGLVGFGVAMIYLVYESMSEK